MLVGRMGSNLQRLDDRFKVSDCGACRFPTIWYDGKMVFPLVTHAEPPAVDLPEELAKDYIEAAQIAVLSPRGAAALLRLVIQKLCVVLGQPGKNINEDIKALVAGGLPPAIQQALDIVRVIGNEAVHPGTIDLRDDTETAGKLFKLVNFIVEKMITEPKQINAMYSGLPADKVAGIQKRDGKP